MHIGHASGAVFGDSLANLLEFVGYNVTREYYINDAGEQVNNLARSVYIRYLEILNIKNLFLEMIFILGNIYSCSKANCK